MRVLSLTLLLALAACSSSPSQTDRPNAGDQEASAQTDECLGHPDQAKAWGDCNVKYTLFEASDKLAHCANHGATTTSVNFQLKLKADGHVRSVKPLDVKPNRQTRCVGRVLRKLKFASPGKDVTITVPYQVAP